MYEVHCREVDFAKTFKQLKLVLLVFNQGFVVFEQMGLFVQFELLQKVHADIRVCIYCLQPFFRLSRKVFRFKVVRNSFKPMVSRRADFRLLLSDFVSESVFPI